MTAHSPEETTAESRQGFDYPRRSVLKITGTSTILPFISGVTTANSDSHPPREDQGDTDDSRPPEIHPHFGYSGTAEDVVPESLSPDKTVELHVDEEKIDTSNLPELTIEFGAFHFDPVGLQVDPGAVVEFDFVTPEHSVTAYHPGQERQQRVPDAVPAFSSTINEHGGFWLYRFEKEGVYDLFCAPHEYGGMAMRIVVGENPGDVVRAPGRPPLPLTGALIGTGLPPNDPDIGHPKLAPRNIVENGPISIGDDPAPDEGDTLDIDLEVTITAPRTSLYYQIDLVGGTPITEFDRSENKLYHEQDRLLEAFIVNSAGQITNEHPDNNLDSGGQGTVTVDGKECTIRWEGLEFVPEEQTVTCDVTLESDEGCQVSLAGYLLPRFDTAFVEEHIEEQELLAADTTRLASQGEMSELEVDLDS